jgi:23S rRNA pseudouridine1911/1915/1917 synthase
MMAMNDLPNETAYAPHVMQEVNGVVAVWKPAGLATQAPPGIPSVESWLRRRLHGESLRGYVGVPHRIDRGVSGVVLFAATPRAARKLSRQFERREVRKTYLAIVDCTDASHDTVERMQAELVTWRDTIGKIPEEARARIVPADETGGREAVTQARLLCRLPPDSLLLELAPVTGRMHQLRLQAAARGLRIVGDDLYGVADAAWTQPRGSEPAGVEDPRKRPIGLHACRIVYADPDTGSEVTVEAALPGYWPESTRAATGFSASRRG